MNSIKNKFLSLVSILLLLCILVGCSSTPKVTIKNSDLLEMTIGSTLLLEVEEKENKIKWSASGDAVTVDDTGLVTAVKAGQSVVTASCGKATDSVTINVKKPDEPNETPDDSNGKPASSREEALERSKKGVVSGSTTVPDQAPYISEYRPMKDGKYILNTNFNFIDENTYSVVDAHGNEVFRIYRGGGYIDLEEVAAYIYAFGQVPPNYVTGKNQKPQSSIWGENLRLNHTKFSGNTAKYPYEPELPNITGCGGDLQYYELDIGTTGTDCDPAYPAKLYNDGKKITRGAARIVYGKCDLDKDGVYDHGELHLFYTYNHYNDFQEYLNYYGGWGEMFGNITGGGKISSKKEYNPTPYVDVERRPISQQVITTAFHFYIPKKYWLSAA